VLLRPERIDLAAHPTEHAGRVTAPLETNGAELQVPDEAAQKAVVRSVSLSS
jgi:hypothetical protein